MNRKKVLLGMSGGTDSSVAAILLQEQGYDVAGITFRFYEIEGNTAYLSESAELADRLGIPHYICDVRKEFEKNIVTYFINEYMSGRTPVPCIVCNNTFKWPLMAKVADEQGIRHIATGHYVRLMETGGHSYLQSGVDPDKDQSFFLWGLPEILIKRMILPLGTLTKTEVREIARQRGFFQIAARKDSLGVCFCPGDYRSFLKKRLGESVFSEGFYAIIKKTLWNGVPFCRSHIEKKKRRGTNGMEDPIVCPAEGTAGHPGRPVQIPDERL